MQEMINIRVSGGDEIKADYGIRLYEIARAYPELLSFPILVARVNNELLELNARLIRDCEAEFLDITSRAGFLVYQRTASFVMICAARDALGGTARVVIRHSINNNYVCELLTAEGDQIRVTAALLARIESRMREIVDDDIVIDKLSMTLDEGVRLCEEMGAWDRVDMLKYRRTSGVNFYRLNGYYDYFYGPMARSTGAVTVFGLSRTPAGGLLLRFPMASDPSEPSEPAVATKVAVVFREAKRWGDILSAGSVGALNDIICAGRAGEFIQTNEALHEKRVAQIADMIVSRGRRLALVSGPSSSGKTTFAKRLAIQLRVSGYHAHIISLDDYFVSRETLPVDEFGEPDYESPDAIEMDRVNADIRALLAGDTVEVPEFDFTTGMRSPKALPFAMGKNDVLIVEGLHALNDRLAVGISDNDKFKIFISVFTQLNIDDHNRIATTDARLIRRIVRDHQSRNFGALTTIRIWPSVGRGEQKHVFPYEEGADAIFNSALVYELCALKQYAEPLLFGISPKVPEYMEAKRLIKFLDSFLNVPSSEVPANSILREFIGPR
ncbi:MAG: nucleoside kinase [Clostridiales bacterium]|jgi:uridine kinase|nr:nucleoside kinase [Clostridiales bacterium]